MIRSITVINYLGESLKLDLERPELSGFIVTSVTGLGPGKATINTVEAVTTDGSRFNSARVSSRNIVISLKYMWKPTIEEVRQLSYKYFPIKKKIKLVIETDNRIASIEGYVESNEPNIFSKDEGADISIVCAFPFFYSAEGDGMVTTVFSGIEPMFEFPFSNESLTDSLLLMSEVQNRSYNNVPYYGDVETGITMTIHAIGEASDISIYNVETREALHINTDKIRALTGSGIKNGDDIIISTSVGSKSATLVRDGESTNILNCLDRGMSWFQLSKGDNLFSYTADTGASNLQFKIENRLVYEGV